jgi:hypothetical protein
MNPDPLHWYVEYYGGSRTVQVPKHALACLFRFRWNPIHSRWESHNSKSYLTICFSSEAPLLMLIYFDPTLWRNHKNILFGDNKDPLLKVKCFAIVNIYDIPSKDSFKLFLLGTPGRFGPIIQTYWSEVLNPEQKIFINNMICYGTERTSTDPWLLSFLASFSETIVSIMARLGHFIRSFAWRKNYKLVCSGGNIFLLHHISGSETQIQ